MNDLQAHKNKKLLSAIIILEKAEKECTDFKTKKAIITALNILKIWIDK